MPAKDTIDTLLSKEQETASSLGRLRGVPMTRSEQGAFAGGAAFIAGALLIAAGVAYKARGAQPGPRLAAPRVPAAGHDHADHAGGEAGGRGALLRLIAVGPSLA